MRRVVVLGLVLAIAPGRAHANQWERIQGGAWLHYELSALRDLDDRSAGRVPEARQLVLAGARLHGCFGTGGTIAYHVGIDLAAGSTVDRAGFAYDVALFPLGIAVRFGRTGVLGFGTGIGAMGAIGTIDDAVTVPIEANLELGGGRLRILARLRVGYVSGADARQRAAPSAPFADELDAMIGVRIGHHYEEWGFPSGNGYWVGVAYRELSGARFAGLVIGYSIDGATPRRPAKP